MAITKPFWLIPGLFALVLVAGCAPAAQEKCVTGDPFPYTSPYNVGGCPADIQRWIDRVNICGHFAGEEPYDEERRASLNKAAAENRCDAVGCDYEALFSRYEGDIVYTGILTGYAEQVYGATENIPHCTKE